MASIKSNIFWNILRVGSNLLFPLITFPYASRILGTDGIGLFNYALSIASYFTLFGALGFNVYGVREVASVKEDAKKLEEAVNSIFTANVITTAIVYILYLIACIWIAGSNFWIYFVIGFSILFSCIGFEWFYQGIEDFKFVTIRTLIVRAVSAVCLFIFVKTPSDLIIYSIITIGATFGNNILNYLRIWKYIHLRLTSVGIWTHVKGASVLFIGTIAVSLYNNMNNILVGALSDMSSVGIFSTGNKVVHMVLTVISAISMSIIPRTAYLINNKSKDEVTEFQRKSINLILYLALPLTAGLAIFSKPIILLFAGDQFAPASSVLLILSLLIVIIPLSSFLGYQVLIPNHEEKYGNYAVITGSVINLVLGFILIPRYTYIGVAVSVIVTETVITLLHFIYSWKFADLTWKDFFPIKSIIATVVMGVSTLLLYNLNDNQYISIAWITVGALIYIGTLMALKDSFFCQMIARVVRTKKTNA